MNLINQVRALWTANTTLNALHPIAKVHTGLAPKGTNFATPYVSITEGSNSPFLRTRHSHYNRQTFTIDIWCNSYTTGRTIRDLVLIPGFLINQTITLDLGSVHDLSLDTANAMQETDDPTQSVWHFMLTFTAHLTVPR